MTSNRRAWPGELPDELSAVYEAIHGITGFENIDAGSIEIGSTIYARKPGDGSAREQAASCQRVLGALANIVEEYATKRYRSNCMNWGMLPFQYAGDVELLNVGDWVFVPGIRDALDGDLSQIRAFVIGDAGAREIGLSIADMTSEEPCHRQGGMPHQLQPREIKVKASFRASKEGRTRGHLL